MTAPKHLWSGDWQRESEPIKEDSPEPQSIERDEPQRTSDAQSTPPSRRRRSLVVGLAVVAAVAVIAGAAFGLNAFGNGGASSKASARKTATITIPQQTPIPQQPAPQPVTPPVNPNPAPSSAPSTGPTVYWLGMQIQTIGPGDVVIDTVALGSAADAAGLEPGEQLQAVNGHQLLSATDVATALQGARAGQPVTAVVSYGSSSPQNVTLTLGAPPSRHP